MATVFRIRTGRGGARGVAGAGGPPVTARDAYVERLHKLIPAEVLALYVAGTGMLDPNPHVQPALWIGWSLLCVAAVVATRIWGTRDPSANPPVQWAAVAIATISFGIWLYQMGGAFTLREDLHDPTAASLALLAWTFFVPLFYRGTDT